MLPSFFIVGPPRTGTSWLHEILKNRVSLPASTKETRFFDVHFQRGIRWYEAHYEDHNDLRQVGEIAPTYFASREARQRIQELVPHAKIICIFRNPVERLISFYRLKRAYGLIPWNFEEALLRDQELAESSLYATHLTEWLEVFGPRQVRATFYEDLRERPQSFLDHVADFIEIPRFKLSAAEMRRVHSSRAMTHPRNHQRTRYATLLAEWLKARHFGKIVAAVKASPVGSFFLGGGPQFAEPSPEATLIIHQVLKDEIEKLESMVGRDLSAWKQPLKLSSVAASAENNCYQAAD